GNRGAVFDQVHGTGHIRGDFFGGQWPRRLRTQIERGGRRGRGRRLASISRHVCKPDSGKGVAVVRRSSWSLMPENVVPADSSAPPRILCPNPVTVVVAVWLFISTA